MAGQIGWALLAIAGYGWFLLAMVMVGQKIESR